MQHSALLLDAAARRGRDGYTVTCLKRDRLVCVVHVVSKHEEALASKRGNQARPSCHGRLCATIMLHLYGLLCPDRTCLATASQLGEQ